MTRTRGNAGKLADELGVTFRTIPITDSVRQHFHDIGHDEKVHDVTFENSQARERTQILMDLANECFKTRSRIDLVALDAGVRRQQRRMVGKPEVEAPHRRQRADEPIQNHAQRT